MDQSFIFKTQLIPMTSDLLQSISFNSPYMPSQSGAGSFQASPTATSSVNAAQPSWSVDPLQVVAAGANNKFYTQNQ